MTLHTVTGKRAPAGASAPTQAALPHPGLSTHRAVATVRPTERGDRAVALAICSMGWPVASAKCMFKISPQHSLAGIWHNIH